MSRMKRCGVVLVLLMALFLLTACDGVDYSDTIAYSQSRTAAVFSGAREGRFQMDFSIWVLSKEVKCSLTAEQSAGVAQMHAVRNAHNIYQREVGNRAYTIDAGKAKEYTEDARTDSGVLGIADLLTGGADTVRVWTGEAQNQTFYCETLQNDKLKVICYFDGGTLKYVRMKVLGMEAAGEVHSVTYNVADGELTVAGFPEEYTKVSELSDLKSLNPFG